MSYGTFGMWGAFLAGGLMTAPRSHMKEGSLEKLVNANVSNIIFIE
jgi:hypothetical protein